jgi:superfamily II DNA or RNA helicase
MNMRDLKASLYKRVLTKRAALKPDITLLPHQERVVSKWQGEDQPPGMLVYHGLGSGKTPTSIAVGESMPGIKNVVVPAALRENYRKQLRQFSTDPRKYHVMSYEEALKGKPESSLTVFDEAHRMGREGTAISMLPRRMTGRKLLLTGTPVRNEPSEIVPLLKAIAPDRPIPKTQEAFNQQFIRTQLVHPDILTRLFLGIKPGERQVFTEPEKFKKLVEGRVDYQPSKGEFPGFDEKHIDVDMTPEQSDLYRGVMSGSPMAWKIRLNLPPSKAESARLNSFLSGVRQISNNPSAYDKRLVGDPVDHSPKLQRMVDDVQKGLKNTANFKGLVYSNYLDAGIVPMANRLTKLGIPNAVFTGELNDKLRKKVIEDYNKGDIKVLLVSGAGSEGLDLKGTKMVQVMEPHWNLARTKQVIGRAIRHQSHSHLPPEERFVTVNWYHSKPQQSFLSRWGLLPPDRGVDRYLYSRAVEKQQIINQMLSSLKEVGAQKPQEAAPLTKAAFTIPDPLLDYLASVAGLRKLQTLARKYRAGASAIEQTADLLTPPRELTPVKMEEEKEAGVKAAVVDYAEGLPDPKRFGDPRQILKNKLLEWVVQEHKARRAGRHLDVRFGEPGGGPSLYSWATKKELPKPGERPISLFQQPLHRGTYADFQGTIPSGYGAGEVKQHDRGKISVTEATRDKIKFVTLHKGDPEYFTMIRQTGVPKNPQTARMRRTQGGSWLLINTTPLKAEQVLGGPASQVGMNKLKFTSIPAEKVDKIFDPNFLVQSKIDGASLLYHVMQDKIEAVSYRQSKAGRPIVHTQRMFGLGGAKPKDLPPELSGTILRGEAYGVRDNKAIPPQELGGLLNASALKSLGEQARRKIQMRNMVFDVVRRGKEPVQPGERWKTLEEVSKYLPPNLFHLPETATTPDEAKSLWNRIQSGEHPLTSEGVIGWPKGDGRPVKVKVMPESDVWVKGVFPGEGKYKGTHAGGFEYATAPEGSVVGRVGTGLSDEARRSLAEEPEKWVDRMARIRSQGKFPGGAHRAPSFIALHEDYPQKTAQAEPVQAGMTQSNLNKLREAIGAKAPILRDPKAEHMGVYVHPESQQYIKGLVEKLPPKTRKTLTPSLRRMLRKYGLIYGSDVNKPAVAAHEMGHSTGSNVMLPVEAAQMNASPLFGGLLASGMAAHTLRNPPIGLGSSLARVGLTGAAGAGAGLLFHLPTLFEEGRASLRGLKALREAGFSDKDVSEARGDMWNAYKSYLSHATLRPAAYAALGTGAALGATGLKALLKKWRR